MNIVYILKSKRNASRYYVGICSKLKNRIAEHNSGECKTTAEGGPWVLHTAIYFHDPKKATAFERYLKTGSGRAFSKRHF